VQLQGKQVDRVEVHEYGWYGFARNGSIQCQFVKMYIQAVVALLKLDLQGVVDLLEMEIQVSVC
jgi:hypothetical protein